MLRVVFAVSLLASVVACAAEPDAWADKIVGTGGLEVEAFWPEASAGVYEVGSVPRMILKVGAMACSAVTATVDIKPFGKPVVTNVVSFSLATGENAFALPASAEFGHFTVTARLRSGTDDLGYVQSAYVVAPPEPERRDPYFMVDKNGVMDPLLDQMRRFGFGTVFMGTPSAKKILEMSDTELDWLVDSYRKELRTGVSARTDFRLYAASCPGADGMKVLFERIAAGIPSLTADEMRKIRRHYSRMASVLSDRVDAWIVQEEFDGYRFGRSEISTNYSHYVSAWGLMARNICDGLREGDPKCRIGMLGINCSDYYSSVPPFAISRQVLWPLSGRFDFVAIDAYSGNWNRMRNRYTPPEESFAKLLSDAAALSGEYGGEPVCANVERCAGIDYRAAFDSAQAVEQADYTMRSMIISKTVESAITYCLHLTAYHASANAMRTDPDSMPPIDLGIWRTVIPAENEYRYVPRPAVMATATAVRLLSFTRAPRLERFQNGLLVATYLCPCGDAGKMLAAVWTADIPFEAEISLPCDVRCVDAMGNERVIPSGTWRKRVSTTPFFLVAEAGGREKMESAFKSVRVMGYDKVEGKDPIVIRRGAIPETPSFRVCGPDDIFPPRAAMPEAGYFPANETVFPAAEVKMAWNDEALFAVVTVTGKEHIQRRKNKDVTGDDCVVFSFYDVSPISNEHPTKGTHAVNFVAYSGPDGACGYVWDYDRKIDRMDCGRVSVDVSGVKTIYKIKMPWADVLPGFRPGKGARFAFNMRYPCAASKTDWTPAPYMLVLQRQLTPVFQMYCRGFLDGCRYVLLD